MGPRAFYHSGKPCLTADQGKESIDTFITEEMIAEMEYHHERRDGKNLNLFLQHPSTPKIMGWHPDLIFETDVFDVVTEDVCPSAVSPEEKDAVMEEEDASVVAGDDTKSCLNRNARFGTKATKGKRPNSRQRRRWKKRKIGNHRR